MGGQGSSPVLWGTVPVNVYYVCIMSQGYSNFLFLPVSLLRESLSSSITILCRVAVSRDPSANMHCAVFTKSGKCHVMSSSVVAA